MDNSVRHFYDELSDSYHLIYEDWEHVGIPRQGEALDRLIRLEMGPSARSVLDCSCGIGTQSIGLAQRGYQVRGTDLSHKAIERARIEAARLGVQAEFAVADMRHLAEQVAGTFDVVLSCDNSVSHLLNDEDLLKAVNGMFAKTRPGGLVIVGMRDYDRMLQERPSGTMPSMRQIAGGRWVVFQAWEWLKDQPIYTVHQFVLQETRSEWQTKHHETQYRALLRHEIESALEAAGFTGRRWHTPDETTHHQPLLTASHPQ